MAYDVNQINDELQKYHNTQYYGQWETDRIIETYFPEGHTGMAIDIGASDGVRGSNTYYFEQIGWDVLCIEANPVFKKVLEIERQYVMSCAVGSEDGQGTLEIFDIGEREILTSVTSLSPDERLVKAHEHIINDRWTEEVDVLTLNTILGNTDDMYLTFMGVTNFDFISIDTEGTELDVLKGLDLNQYNFKLMVIENNYEDVEIEEYLLKFGYKKVQRYKINDFYTKG